jgi:hypothetical protein
MTTQQPQSVRSAGDKVQDVCVDVEPVSSSAPARMGKWLKISLSEISARRRRE